MKRGWWQAAVGLLLVSSIGLEGNAAPSVSGGTILVDTRVSSFDSPLVLSERLIVASGVNFVIDPGVEIKVLHDDWAFSVFGSLTIGSEFGEVVVRGNSNKFLEVPPSAVNAKVAITGLIANDVGEVSVLSGKNVTIDHSRFSGAHYIFTEWSPAYVRVNQNVFYSEAGTTSPPVNGRCNSYGLALNHSLGTIELHGNSFQGGDVGKSASCSAWVSHAAPEQLIGRHSFSNNAFDTGQAPIAYFRTSANLGRIFVNSTSPADLINPVDAMVPESVTVTYALLESRPSTTAKFWQPIEREYSVEGFKQRLFRGSGHIAPFTKLSPAQLDALSSTIRELAFTPKRAHCVGIRTTSMTYAQTLEIRKHAKAICEEITDMGIEVKTWYGSKLSSAISLAGDILLVFRGN